MAEVNELRGEIKELRQAIARIESGIAKGLPESSGLQRWQRCRLLDKRCWSAHTDSGN